MACWPITVHSRLQVIWATSAAAKAEMAQSPYDSNHDGMCDNSACENIAMPIHSDGADGTFTAAQTFASNMADIGIKVMPAPIANGKLFYASIEPSKHTAVRLQRRMAN